MKTASEIYSELFLASNSGMGFTLGWSQIKHILKDTKEFFKSRKDYAVVSYIEDLIAKGEEPEWVELNNLRDLAHAIAFPNEHEASESFREEITKKYTIVCEKSTGNDKK